VDKQLTNAYVFT